MAKAQRKAMDRLKRRQDAYEESEKRGQHKHTHHRPGSQKKVY